MLIRFSIGIVGEPGSAEAEPNTRGIALELSTEEGNCDLLGKDARFSKRTTRRK